VNFLNDTTDNQVYRLNKTGDTICPWKNCVRNWPRGNLRRDTADGFRFLSPSRTGNRTMGGQYLFELCVLAA